MSALRLKAEIQVPTPEVAEASGWAFARIQQPLFNHAAD
jgi:hypothetical protein